MKEEPFAPLKRALNQVEQELAPYQAHEENERWIAALRGVLSRREALPDLSDELLETISAMTLQLVPGDDEGRLRRLMQSLVAPEVSCQPLLAHWRLQAAKFRMGKPAVAAAVLRRDKASVPEEQERLKRAIDKVKRALDKGSDDDE